MKKLIVAIAAVASAFGLYADDLKNTIGFEQLQPGTTLDVTKGDDGNPGMRYWYSTDTTAPGTVRAYGTDGKYGYTEGDKIVDPAPGDNYLEVANVVPLYRRVIGNEEGLIPRDLSTGDVYFDVLTKFSVRDGLDVSEDLDNTGVKIAVWAGSAEGSGKTNLFVTAAAGATGSSTPAATNYTLNVGANFDYNAWHRVTVRSIIANSDVFKVAGFLVFVDGVPVACGDADYADKFGVALKLTTEAAKFKTDKKLFIGLVNGNDAVNVSAFGFLGTGAIDDVAITDAANAPSFAKGAKEFSLTWDPDAFTSITATPNPGTTFVLNVADGSTNLVLDVAATTLTIDATPKSGYVLTGLESDEVGVEGYKFTGITGTASGKINADKAAYMIDDTPYATFEDALDAAVKAGVPTTIKLAADTEGWAAMAEVKESTADITFDLNGKTLTFTDYVDDTIFYVTAGKLTVIDSVGGGKIDVILPTENNFAGVFYAEEDGVVMVGSDAESDKGITINGVAIGDLNGGHIYKGNFNKDDNENLDVWLEDDETYEVVDTVKDGYWTVRKKDGPEPETSFTVTVPSAEHTTIAVTNGETEVGTTNGVYTLAKDSAVSVAYTAAEGYEITANATTNIEALVENVTVVGPTVAPIGYTVTYVLGLDGATNATDNIMGYTIETEAFTLLPAGCEGYTFNNWTNAEGAVVSTIAGGGTGDLTLYASFTAVQTDPIPPLPPTPTPTDVSNAVDQANFADPSVKDLIAGDAEKYSVFKAWSGTVTGGEQAVVGSSFAAKSFELSPVVETPTLFTGEPTMTITEIKPDATVTTSWDFSIKLTDGAAGDTVVLTEAIKDYVKVATDLGAAQPWGDVSPAQVSATVTEGIATVVVAPTVGATKYFMKVIVK